MQNMKVFNSFWLILSQKQRLAYSMTIGRVLPEDFSFSAGVQTFSKANFYRLEKRMKIQKMFCFWSHKKNGLPSVLKAWSFGNLLRFFAICY